MDHRLNHSLRHSLDIIIWINEVELKHFGLLDYVLVHLELGGVSTTCFRFAAVAIRHLERNIEREENSKTLQIGHVFFRDEEAFWHVNGVVVVQCRLNEEVAVKHLRLWMDKGISMIVVDDSVTSQQIDPLHQTPPGVACRAICTVVATAVGANEHVRVQLQNAIANQRVMITSAFDTPGRELAAGDPVSQSLATDTLYYISSVDVRLDNDRNPEQVLDQVNARNDVVLEQSHNEHTNRVLRVNDDLMHLDDVVADEAQLQGECVLVYMQRQALDDDLMSGFVQRQKVIGGHRSGWHELGQFPIAMHIEIFIEVVDRLDHRPIEPSGRSLIMEHLGNRNFARDSLAS